MKIIATSLPGCLIVEPKVFGDSRGFFFEAFNSSKQVDANAPIEVHQINVSRSNHGVLRGLHFQWPQPQGKLVWVLEGEVFDVAVDIRKGSPTFGQWEACLLSESNHRQFWIPEGFAHGFQVTSDSAIFCYLCTRPYQADFDRSIQYADPALGIEWPNDSTAALSEKDRVAPLIADMMDKLPEYENISHRR
jgi:dTDP-4-dehydrorhamnose 3,5-epimerase